MSDGIIKLLSPLSCSDPRSVCCPACGGLPGPEEKRNDDETEGRDDTESPEGLEGDGRELRGEEGCDEVFGLLLVCTTSVERDMRRGGRWRIVSALVLGCGSSSFMAFSPAREELLSAVRYTCRIVSYRVV